MGPEPSRPGDSTTEEYAAAPGYDPAYENSLAEREYERLARLLENARASQTTSKPLADRLAKIARDLCHACEDCRNQETFYQRSYTATVAREQRLRESLRTVLHSLGLVSETRSAQEARVERSATAEEEEAAPLPAGARGSARPGPKNEVGHPTETEAKTATPSTVESLIFPDHPEVRPSLVVYCLGLFQVYLDEQLVESWPSGKGKAIFKYIVSHRELPVPKEVLMELYWPDADPDAARNSLNVAMYGLRQALRSVSPDLSYVLFQDDAYLLNPELNIWVDIEEFSRRYRSARRHERAGHLQEAIQEYRAAATLYQGDFLAEDRYSDWISSRRLQFCHSYVALLERLSHYHFDTEDFATCINYSLNILAIDPCREDAHRLVMRCYAHQGQRYLALRQYHLCVTALKDELNVAPTQKTEDLFRQLSGGKHA